MGALPVEALLWQHAMLQGANVCCMIETEYPKKLVLLGTAAIVPCDTSTECTVSHRRKHMCSTVCTHVRTRAMCMPKLAKQSAVH